VTRSTDEWIGATDDAAIPPRVRLRVFERYGGICQETGRKITPADQWDCDHEIALANGGQHRESNLRPVLREAHRSKTKQDVALKAKIDRVRKKHLGVKTKKAKLPGSRDGRWKKKLDGTVVRRGE
jgi:5-methylcytosine-specific restriction enzyme A